MLFRVFSSLHFISLWSILNSNIGLCTPSISIKFPSNPSGSCITTSKSYWSLSESLLAAASDCLCKSFPCMVCPPSAFQSDHNLPFFILCSYLPTNSEVDWRSTSLHLSFILCVLTLYGNVSFIMYIYIHKLFIHIRKYEKYIYIFIL